MVGLTFLWVWWDCCYFGMIAVIFGVGLFAWCVGTLGFCGLFCCGVCLPCGICCFLLALVIVVYVVMLLVYLVDLDQL